VTTAIVYLVILLVLGGMFALNARNRRRQAAAEQDRIGRIGVGTEVMTTSGLYGTVVARHEDDTVTLAIAPGVEVRWAAAALRDAASLTPAYRRPLEHGGRASGSGHDPDGPVGEQPADPI
jgi:preprotein translocase subunit YajC